MTEATTLTEYFTEELAFLKIKQTRVSNGYCEIYLYKGIGGMKGIDFSVKQEKDSCWQFSYFSYLNSWEMFPIDLNKLK